MNLPRPRSLYDVLNVSPEAEPVVIEAAYKALIKKYHPDAAEDAPVSRDAAEINKAFALLKDPSRRAEYDHRLWVREQALRTAELQPPVRRGSRAAGAAGWLVAILLGGVVAMMASGRAVPVPAVGNQAAASDPVSVPAFLEKERAEADMQALAAIVAARDPGLPPPPRLRIVNAAPPAPAAEAAAPPAAPEPPRRKAERKRRPAKPKAAANDPDFLEREGYIY